jgi:hypothetical protein
MINKEFIFSKIEELEGAPEGGLIFKNNSIYFDHLNLSWSGNDVLRGYGVAASLADKFDPFYGRIGKEASEALKKPVPLTRDEIKTLFRVSIRVSVQEVSEYAGVDILKNLPDSVQAVLVFLWRRFGRLTKPEFPALAMVSKMLIGRRVKLAIRYLKDEKGWPAGSGNFTFQRLKAAGILEAFIKEGV